MVHGSTLPTATRSSLTMSGMALASFHSLVVLWPRATPRFQIAPQWNPKWPQIVALIAGQRRGP
jgi:hypothetical protein